MSESTSERPEIIPSPNIWQTPDVYEVENRGVDRDHVIEEAMRSVLDWSGLDVVDIGCGTGFHLPYFASTASSRTPRWPPLRHNASQVCRPSPCARRVPP